MFAILKERQKNEGRVSDGDEIGGALLTIFAHLPILQWLRAIYTRVEMGFKGPEIRG